VNEGTEARRYLRRHHAGVLSTLSARLGGYPFGSVTPFVTDHAACPVILVSRLAEHTRNLDADARASLLVHDAAAEVQMAARLTLVANAVEAADPSALASRYLRYFPDAQRLLDLGDFSFYVLEPVFVRHIAGFGTIRSITAGSFAPPPNGLAGIEAQVLEHMNHDHAEALRALWARWGGGEPGTIAMIGIDCDGFDLRGGDRRLRVDFQAAATDARSAREALVALARAARQ
jgi:putative heme iron utilization protein